MTSPARMITGLLTLALCWSAAAQELPVPTLGETPRPWLLYQAQSENSPMKTVMVAWQGDGGMQTDRVLVAPYLLVEHLSGPKFLVSSGDSEAESARYIIDIETGERLALSERRGYDPMAADLPDTRYSIDTPTSTVSLIQDADDTTQLEFLTVNYSTMSVDRKTLDKSLFKTPFDDGVRLFVAPDGKHIAFLEARSAPENTENLLSFRLKVYHFSNGSVNVVDDEIYAQRSKHARTPFVFPAVGWADNTHLVYSHTEPQVIGGPDQTLVRIGTVEVEQGGKESVLDQLMPLVYESARFGRDLKNNYITYTHPTKTTEEFIVMAEATTLVPYPTPRPDIVLKKGAGLVQVLRNGEVIFNETHFGESVEGLVSNSLQHAAFTLAAPGDGAEIPQQTDLFVSIKREEVQKVGDTAYAIELLTWVE